MPRHRPPARTARPRPAACASGCLAALPPLGGRVVLLCDDATQLPDVTPPRVSRRRGCSRAAPGGWVPDPGGRGRRRARGGGRDIAGSGDPERPGRGPETGRRGPLSLAGGASAAVRSGRHCGRRPPRDARRRPRAPARRTHQRSSRTTAASCSTPRARDTRRGSAPQRPIASTATRPSPPRRQAGRRGRLGRLLRGGRGPMSRGPTSRATGAVLPPRPSLGAWGPTVGARMREPAWSVRPARAMASSKALSSQRPRPPARPLTSAARLAGPCRRPTDACHGRGSVPPMCARASARRPA